MLQFMESQRVGHNWATELNCTHTTDEETELQKGGRACSRSLGQ